MTENKGNIGFEEDRDEYEAENIFWVEELKKLREILNEMEL